MRRWILMLVAVLATAIPLDAQTVEATARGSGYYHLIVDGAEVSRHVAEREAFQQALNWLLSDPTMTVYYEHRYTVDVTMGGISIPPPPEDSVPTPPIEPPPPPDVVDGDPFFVEGFDSGDLSNTMGGFSWSSPNRTQVVDWFSRDEGGHSLRFRYPGGAPGTDSFAEQRFTVGRDLSEYWLEYWIYLPDGLEDEEGLFPEGFSSAEYEIRSGDGPSNNKWFRAWPHGEGDGGEHGSSVWGSRWSFERRAASGSLGAITGSPRIEPWLGEGAPFQVGRWHQFRLHVRFSSNTQGLRADPPADGIVEVWVDGVLVASNYEQPLHGNLDGSGDPSYVNAGYFMGWANSGFDEETYVFIDDIAWYATDPGWGGS